MKREIRIIGIVAVCLLAGCQRIEPEAPEIAPEEQDNSIIFRINQSTGWKNQETKANDPMILTDEDGDEMTLQTATIDGIKSPLDSGFEGETKGTPISAGNFSLYDGELALKALWGQSAYIDDFLHLQGSQWTAVKGTYYWPVTQASIDFWAWAPAKTTYGTGTFKSPTIANGTMSFSYGLQAHAETTAGSGFYDDAKHQPDLLYVRSLQHTKDDNNSAIGLEFQHALAAVKFMIKTNSEGYVKSISLLNVNAKGDCVYTPASLTNPGSFVWTDNNVALKGTNGTEYTQSFEAQNLAAGASKVVTNDNEGTVFMMLPQTLGIQKIRIVYHENKYNRDMVFTGTIPGDAWLAGKTYLYTLDYRTFSITVSDKVSGNVKTNLVITNTGSTPAYIRATLVGYWAKTGKNGKEIIIAPWDQSKTTYVGLMGKDWFKEGDFYYYKNVVPGSTAIPSALFTSLTNTEEAPVAGAKLYIKVSAQAVEYDSAKARVADAWGSGIASSLNAQ